MAETRANYIEPYCPICGQKALRRNADKQLVCRMGHKWSDQAYNDMDCKVVKTKWKPTKSNPIKQE